MKSNSTQTKIHLQGYGGNKLQSLLSVGTTSRGSSFKIYKLIIFASALFIANLFFGQLGLAQTSVTNPTSPWQAPAGVTGVTVQVWGGGGKGGLRASGDNVALAGGGGGAYAMSFISVTSGNGYTVTVGAGSTTTAAGGDSWFSSTSAILAKGGGSVGDNSNTRGAGGLASAGIGTIKFNGGTGAAGTAASFGGGGGSSAGTAAAGNYTNNTTTSRTAGTIANGGSGGQGAANNAVGANGSVPGGGGGGGYRAGTGSTQDPGDGAIGRVIISYYVLTGVSASTPVCVGGTSTVTINATTINLPTGTYTVTYNLSAPNAATGLTASMTVSTAGTGQITTSALATAGTTTVTITQISNGTITGGVGSNNTSSILVNSTAPTVTAGAASGITPTTATVPGTITSIGCTAISTYGVEYSTTNSFANGTGIPVAGTNLAAGAFSVGLSGLTQGTIYYFHTYATNGGGTSYSTQSTFTTTTATRILSTSTLSAFGAQCTNSVNDPSSFIITGTNLDPTNVTVGALAGFTYSTLPGGTYTTTLSLPQPGGPFSQQIFVTFTPIAVLDYSGNIPVGGGGASSVNVAASGSGVNTAPTVTAGTATDITLTGATVPGTITVAGCTAATGYGVEYSTTNSFANGTGIPVAGSNIAAGAFSVALSGLTQGTIYYYHSYATNGGGTSYSTQGTFTTTAAVPTLIGGTLTAFGAQNINSTYGPNTFTINGSSLSTANVTVGALPGFTYSTTSGGTYTTSLSLAQPGGSYTQTIYVRFTPTAIQDYSGNIPVGGGGATPVNVAASGSGVGSAPILAITGVTDHGTSCVGVAATPIVYTITNTGGSAALDVTVTSNAPVQFAVSGAPTTIAANGGTATYSVTFTPGTAGAKTAVINVYNSTPGTNYPVSNLTGTGIAGVAGLTSSDADNIICAGTPVTFTGTGGTSYEFFVNAVSQGAASATATFITSALTDQQVVTVRATNGNGCSAISTGITTTVNTLPAAPEISGITTVNVGSITLLGSPVANGVWTSSDQTRATVDPASGEVAGIAVGTSTITYTITNNNNCTNFATVVVTVSEATGIEDVKDNNGLKFKNHPNPFSGNTTLNYTLPSDGRVTITIRNLAGQVVKTIVNEVETQGDYTFNIDLGELRSGVYFATLRLKNDGKDVIKTIRIVKGN